MRTIAYTLLCALLTVSTVALAQNPAGRTTKTIIADVLAQMPAQDGERFDVLMQDLASTGKEGVLQLIGMMTPPGDGSNARAEYALSGLSHWVSAEGREERRLAVSDACIEALSRVSDREVGAFIINQLELVGRDEAVEILTACLNDDRLSGPAKAALASISGNALPEQVVSSGELAPEAALVRALYDKIAAKPSQATKLLKKALKDDSRNYRYAALRIASRYADEDMYRTLVKSTAKAGPEVRADILNWLGDECDRSAARRTQIVPLAGAEAQRLLTLDDIETVSAAARLLAKVGGADAIRALADRMGQVVVVAGSAEMQRREDEKTGAMVDVLAAALASTKGDVASAVAPIAANNFDAAGSVAALELLAMRKATAHSGAVFEQLSSPMPPIRAAAFAALADVVGAGDLDRLNSILGSAATDELPDVQHAMTAAAAEMPAADRYAAAQRLMNTAPADKQYLYYPLLASSGDRKALTTITERFDSESGAAKDAAFTALVGWQGTAAASKLLAIARDPAAAKYFDPALARYTAIAGDTSQGGETRAAMLADALSLSKTDAQKRTALNLLASTGSYPGMTKAGEYLADANKGVANAAAVAVMTVALANLDFTGAEVRDLLTRAATALDNGDADYQRKAIAKHLDEMVDAEPFALSDEERAEGFKVLFDGTNLDAWTGNKTDYRVQSGNISLYPSRSFGGNLYTAEEYGNFVFRFEFMLTPGANNGVGIRTKKDRDAAYYGMEIQILDHDDPAYLEITPLQVHGSVYGVIGAKRAVLKPEGEWNVEEIYANGDNIRVTLNGEVILDGNIRQAAKGGTADGKEHPGLFNKKGYIGFLGHGSELKFRHIRIKELP